jgi:hypothetical protein
MGFLRPDIYSPMLVMSGVFLLFCVTSRAVRARGKIFDGSLLLVISVAPYNRDGRVDRADRGGCDAGAFQSWAGWLAYARQGGADCIVVHCCISLGLEDNSPPDYLNGTGCGEMRRVLGGGRSGVLAKALLGLGGKLPSLWLDWRRFMLTHNARADCV